MKETFAAASPVASTLTVTCLPGGRTFEATSEETILEAALRQGLLLAHSCRNGACGTCKTRMVEGEVNYRVQPAALTAEDAASGYALPCQARARTAVALECSPISVDAATPMRRLVTRVQSLDKLAPDVMRIRLKIPANGNFAFYPGQYIDIVMNPALRRSLSVANSPDEDGYMELHLRNYGGPFSTHVFNTMKVGDLIRVEGPLGTFFVRADSDKPIVFVASGTGFAPVKAMIEDQLRNGGVRPISLYWGGRRPADLYHHELAHAWATDHGIDYVPVVSEALPEDTWTGRVGFVHQAVLQDMPSLASHQVYACGAPIVVESARRDFTSLRGLPPTEFYADAFLPGVTPAVNR
ncbi:CDP-6-deoxy-delta-3,4-glucoseen reductase [Variovorax paradoxus]|uniref:CDP-6-deoxy-delta-3,4-glucoseen reductase n=1 Tax=Variovorax paradoxus TaxID=34073 RepID=UPI003ECEC56E